MRLSPSCLLLLHLIARREFDRSPSFGQMLAMIGSTFLVRFGLGTVQLMRVKGFSMMESRVGNFRRAALPPPGRIRCERRMGMESWEWSTFRLSVIAIWCSLGLFSRGRRRETWSTRIVGSFRLGQSPEWRSRDMVWEEQEEERDEERRWGGSMDFFDGDDGFTEVGLPSCFEGWSAVSISSRRYSPSANLRSSSSKISIGSLLLSCSFALIRAERRTETRKAQL